MAKSINTASSAVTSSKANINPLDHMDNSEIEVAVVRASNEMECRRMTAMSTTDTNTHSWTISNSTLQTSPMSVDTSGGGISNATTCQINSNTTTINGVVVDGEPNKIHRTSDESTKLIIKSQPTDFENDNSQQRVNVVAISTAADCKPIQATAMDPNHRCNGQQRIQECHSSSDENRSSGHASMSDTGNGSSSPGCINTNHRNDTMLDPLDEGRLVCRSAANLPVKKNHEINSVGTSSTYSSAESESSIPAQNLDRYSSLETVNTNVTSVDSIVWIDNHNRLIELARTPWNQQCIMRVLAAGRCRERISPEIIPRLSYLLQVYYSMPRCLPAQNRKN